MRRLLATLLLGAPLLAACASSAPEHKGRWNPNGGARDENWHSPAAALLRYDANHDGTLTRAELKAGLKAEFDTYDAARKNCLGADQVRDINQLRVQQDASQASPLVDWNQDGCIDFNEYSASALSLFDTLDKDGNGQLTADELKGRQPGAGATPGQGAGGGGRHGRGRRGGGPPGQ